jgi:hypothetical protein
MNNEMHLLMSIDAEWVDEGEQYSAMVSTSVICGLRSASMLKVVRQYGREATEAWWSIELHQHTVDLGTDDGGLAIVELGEILGPQEAQQWLVRLRVIAERAKRRDEFTRAEFENVLPNGNIESASTLGKSR